MASAVLDVVTPLVHAANAGRPGPEMFDGLCRGLLRAGVPVWRAALQVDNLNPVHFGSCFHWTAGAPAFELEHTHAFASGEGFASSPYMASRRDGFYRRRIARDGPDPAVPMTRTLQAQGATDFVADIVADSPHPLPPGVTWATRAPAGFAAGAVALLRALTPHLALAFGLGAERTKTATVLRTYLGAGPARAVGERHVRRGDVTPLDAVILLTDLRGFSASSDALEPAALLARLSTYCESVVDAVEDRGGDVLKFIGDGILSVFPIGPGATLAEQCGRAVAAVAAARARLADRDRGSADPVAFTAVLHAGSLGFGNIGATRRLDFTAIGPAVNLASRIEAKAKELGCDTVMTAAVAEQIGGPVASLGTHGFKNIAAPCELFTPATAMPDPRRRA